VAGNAESTAKSVEEISSSIEEMGNQSKVLPGMLNSFKNQPMKHPR